MFSRKSSEQEKLNTKAPDKRPSYGGTQPAFKSISSCCHHIDSCKDHDHIFGHDY